MAYLSPFLAEISSKFSANVPNLMKSGLGQLSLIYRFLLGEGFLYGPRCYIHLRRILSSNQKHDYHYCYCYLPVIIYQSLII